MQQVILKQLKALPIISNYYLTGGTGGGGTITGGTNGLGVDGKNIILGGVVNQTTNVSLGVGTGYTRINLNHTDNNILIEYNSVIDYDLPFNGAKIGVDSGGVIMTQNNYQNPERGSVPYIRDLNGHIAFQILEENQVYSVDASGNPTTIGLGNLDPWLTGGTFISQGNISIQGGEALEYSIEFNVDTFNVQAINNIGLQSGSLLNLQSNMINAIVDETITLNSTFYNAGIIIGAVSGDTSGIKLSLGDGSIVPETGALFYQNEFGVLDSLNPTSDGDVLTLVDGLPTWGSGIGIITGATNGLSVDNGNVILGGDFTGANLNDLSGDAVFQINIGEETVTNKHSLYFDTTQFYLQSIGTSGNTRNYNLSQNFTADGFEQLIFVAKDDVQISNTSGYLTLNDGLTIAGTDSVADVMTSFHLSETDITLTDNRSVKKGIEYASNYSTNFTSRSLVDKGWVTANTLTILNPIKTIGANYTVTSNDINYVIEITGSTNRTITFPSGLTNGFNITINNLMSSNTVTIVAGSGTTLNLKGSILATQYDGASLYINNNFIRGFGNLT